MTEDKNDDRDSVDDSGVSCRDLRPVKRGSPIVSFKQSCTCLVCGNCQVDFGQQFPEPCICPDCRQKLCGTPTALLELYEDRLRLEGMFELIDIYLLTAWGKVQLNSREVVDWALALARGEEGLADPPTGGDESCLS